jgi:hypothetical protein
MSHTISKPLVFRIHAYPDFFYSWPLWAFGLLGALVAFFAGLATHDELPLPPSSEPPRAFLGQPQEWSNKPGKKAEPSSNSSEAPGLRKSVRLLLLSLVLFFISFILFVVWIVSLMRFSRQVYALISSNHIRVWPKQGHEKVFSLDSVRFGKKVGNFIHYILGFGAGDLILTASDNTTLVIPNVPFISTKLQKLKKDLIGVQVIE